MREVREETGLEIEPHGLAGYRQVIARDDSWTDRAAFCHSTLRRALARRRDFAQ